MKRIFVWAIALFAIASCKNSSTTSLAPSRPEFGDADTSTLELSKPKKLNWAAIKTVAASPSVQSLDIGKLPVSSFDSSDFRPFSKPVIEKLFNINSLQANNFDIEKLSIQPLNFKDFILPEPKLIRTVPARIKNSSQLIYELGEIPELTSAGISYLYKDKDGFLWIATFRALYRYDGENLQQFVAGPMENGTSGILQDKQGRIWVSEYNGGIQVLDIKAGILKKLKASSGLKSNKVFGMMLDDEQRIWVSYNKGGVDIIDVRNKTIKLLDKENGLFTKTTTIPAVQGNDGNIYIPTFGEGLNVIDLKNKKIRYATREDGLSSDSLISMMTDHEGKLLIGYSNGVIDAVDLNKNKIQSVSEVAQRNAAAVNLFEDDKNRIWVGTNKGVQVIDPAARLSRVITTADGLASSFIHKIVEDNSGTMWIGANDGLDLTPNNKIIKEHVGKGRITTVYQDINGLIWRGSEHGLDIVDLKNRSTRHLGRAQGLGHDSIQTISGQNRKVFVCTNNGFDIIDPDSKTISHIDQNRGLTSRTIVSVMPDNSGRLWLGGDSGIDIYDVSGKTVKHLGKEEGLNDDHFIDDIKADAEGSTWIVTRDAGVNKIDANLQYLWSLAINDGLKILLPGAKGDMWIGTPKGLYDVESKNNRLISFSLTGITSLSKHNKQLFAGTNNGIINLSPYGSDSKGWRLKYFGQAYGIVKTQRGTSFTNMFTSDGTFCWGDDGLTFLKLPDDEYVLPVAITGISIMDEPRYFIDGLQYDAQGRDTLAERDDTLIAVKKKPVKTAIVLSDPLKKASVWKGVKGAYNLPVNLELPHDQSFIQFHFNNQNLNRRDTTWYRYILHGAENEAHEVVNVTSSRNYFNLSPGKYEFEVVSKTADTEWSAPAKFSFIINPPWWQTWWAYALYICVFAGSIWFVGYFRSRQLVRDKRELERKIQQRTEEMVHQKEEIEAQRDSLENAVNQLQNAQSQLVQTEKLASLGELTAGIAHEIQNPLNFVNNFAEVSMEMIDELKEEQSKDVRDHDLELELIESLALNLEKINHHGKRADAIVKNMLQHSRANTGERQLTDINALADEYMRLSYHGLRAKDKSFNSEMTSWPHASLPKANVISQDIGRVLLNIFNNAFYAVHQKKLKNPDGYKPEVQLITLYKRGSIEIRIRDNGIGIPASIKEKIMQPFFTTKPAGQGTGLGLSLSYDIIVKGHGGKLNIDSKEGEYTEFTIIIPVNQTDEKK
ncbi:two-component regulator propeller domain-containing protein [Mucilaginibacter sp. L3T2-6]|uniref:sensor histidine kinase n=1 Tax=Mucilaginibacter sp. L3T2-6 TaxID=3062491 RepID=UPI002676EC0C|nr:two-component regulator propeller domain-containing protein [Mucilaginibacter sp. L3T2-6]MDO3645206.1 ATP-binding protein [Mucilaginibacter sp. L3T2-6]MDV6217661.1 ATP-binding protein [Mucilaginibacter sp. L3T2-6]